MLFSWRRIATEGRRVCVESAVTVTSLELGLVGGAADSVGAFGVGEVVGASAGGGGGVEADASVIGSGYSRLDISSPNSARYAMVLPTFMLLEPSGTIILARMPSSWDSTSICALSVSISSNTSPTVNSWPSHLYRLV